MHPINTGVNSIARQAAEKHAKSPSDAQSLIGGTPQP